MYGSPTGAMASRGTVSEKKEANHESSFAVKVGKGTFDELRIALEGSISMDNAELVRRELITALEADPLKNVVLDLSELQYFDSSGTAILMDVGQLCELGKNSLKLERIPPHVQGLLSLVDLKGLQAEGILQPRPREKFLVQIGERAVNLWNTSHDNLVFIGGAVDALVKDLAHPGQRRWDSLSKLIERCGTDAVPIVLLLNFLMGAILAFQSAIQLRKFGANIFVADLVGLSIVLEMGPLLTALIISGRSGAAFAAQIGTMQVTEEVDALRVMGVDPMSYLVSPRIVAVALAAPCLTLIGDLVGTVGGCLVAGISLDITPTAYFNQLHRVLELTDVLKGLIKSFVFGIQVAMVGCLRGFQVRGGAESVGAATTSAVVTCIFVLTVTDAVFSILFYYAPPFWKF